ncbi:hypothetical protein L210DRAFT_3643378 [Boletus edulis BED1]|uniref:Uncharacterized protein n=1 Tax=Boletus edulis BED1 TaxID=1328754 RepID=A0AAD4BZM2_BOLED|nr:hypothetical protein L210DRAFT_3643378 [Boletus edulis BED1]
MSHEAQIDPMLMEPPTSANTGANKRKENLTDEVTNGRKKKTKTSGSITDCDKAKYELVRRKLVCLLYPFGSPRTAINIGLKVESGRENELDNDSAEIVRHNWFYEGILTHALGLAEELNNPRMEAKELQDICTWITRGMSDQRSTDLGSVKHAGLGYLFSNGKILEPSIAKLEDKSMHGFNHPEIARMLCPRKKLDVFDEDPDMITGAHQEGTIRTMAGNWPTCFYEEGVYDPENRAEGLFRGHAAFRFYTHLFIGPSAASTNTVTLSSSKISKNRAWGLTEVTLSIIAYVHVLLYFTLSTAPRWCMAIGQMDLAEMAWAIIEMFDNKDDWTKATLAWWNSRAFLKGHGSCKDTDSDDDTVKIRAQQKKAVQCTPNQLLQSDGIKVRAKAVKEEDEGSDIADEGSDDGESVQSDEVEEPEGEEENCDLVDVIDDEDPIIPDDDEILDDYILIQEGYGAL